MIKNLDFISKEFENILVKFSLAKLLVTGEVPVPIYTTGVNIRSSQAKGETSTHHSHQGV